MDYRLGFYDWNGTLANDPHICHECVMQIFRVFAPSLPLPTLEEWRLGHGNSDFLEFYYRRGVPRTTTIELMGDVWIPHYEAQLTDDQPLVRDGAEALLAFCVMQGITNIVVSSSVDNVEHHLENSGIHHFFEAIHVKLRDKRIAFREILGRHDVEPCDAFYVDDTFDGIAYAKEVGLVTFGLTTGCNHENRIREAKPDHVVASFQEVLYILQKQR